MKKLLFILVILSFMTFLKAQDKISEIYYDNGNVKEMLSFKNDKLHGKCVTFSLEGRVTATAFYKDGIKNGRWKVWSEDGVLLYDMKYKNGQKIGEWKMYDNKGNLLSVKNY